MTKNNRISGVICMLMCFLQLDLIHNNTIHFVLRMLGDKKKKQNTTGFGF